MWDRVYSRLTYYLVLVSYNTVQYILVRVQYLNRSSIGYSFSDYTRTQLYP